jgi:hypothetical protein
MPQYPFPPVPDWFYFEEPVGSGRRIDYRPDARRFRYLSLVQRRHDGTLEVLRGDPDVLEQIAAAHADTFPIHTPGDELRNRTSGPGRQPAATTSSFPIRAQWKPASRDRPARPTTGEGHARPNPCLQCRHVGRA